MAEGNSPEVQKYLTLVRLQPDNPDAHFKLGSAYEDSGVLGEAVKHYEIAIKLNPRHALSFLHRGFIFAKGGELHLALQEWAKAFELDPHLHNKISTPELAPLYKNKFDSAIQQLERPIIINPKDAFARYQLGTAYKYFQKPELALQSLKRALEINPSLWEAYLQCGEIFAQLGQNKLAITNFQRAIDANSRFADTHYQLGLIYEKENMSALALRHLERAIELDPESSKVQFALGNVFLKQTKFKKAMKQYQKALDLDPADARIHLRLAECCKQMYRPDLAITCYERAVELDPESSEAVYELGSTALQLGDIERAIKGFRKALAINSQDAYAHYSLAQAYHRQKDYESAATHYGEAARLNPKDAYAAYNLGLMRDELGQPDQAIEAYRKAVELKPHDAQYHLNLGRAYLAGTRPSEAAAELKQAIKLNPNDLETNFLLADVQMDQGHYDDAITLYRKVVELNPESVEARYRMAEAFSTLDMPDYAFEAFQETVRLDPRHYKALHGLGTIYLSNRNKPSIAVDFFQQALDVEPSFSASMTSLGEAYVALGQPEKALQFFERKLEENRSNPLFISKYTSALADAGHSDKATAELRSALQLNPENLDLRATQARLFRKLGRTQDSLDAWQSLTHMAPDKLDYHFEVGVISQELGQEDQARAAFRKVLNIFPNHVEAKKRLDAMAPYAPPGDSAPTPTAPPISAAPATDETFISTPFGDAGQPAAPKPPQTVAESSSFVPEELEFDPGTTFMSPASRTSGLPTIGASAPDSWDDDDSSSASTPSASFDTDDPFEAAPAARLTGAPVPADPPVVNDDPFADIGQAGVVEDRQEDAFDVDDPFAPAPVASPTPPPVEDIDSTFIGHSVTPEPVASPAAVPDVDETFIGNVGVSDDPFRASASEDPFAESSSAAPDLNVFASPESSIPTAAQEDPFAPATPVDVPFAAALEPVSAPPSEEPAAADETFSPDEMFGGQEVSSVTPEATLAPAPSGGEDPFADGDVFGESVSIPVPQTEPEEEPVIEPEWDSEPGAVEAAPAEEPVVEPEWDNEPGAVEVAPTEEAVVEQAAPEEPRPELVSASPTDPSFPAEEVLQQAILANVTGRTEDAQGLFEEILQRAPEYSPVYFHFGQFLRSQDNSARAIELFRVGLQRAEADNDANLLAQLRSEYDLTVGQPTAETTGEEAPTPEPAAEAAPSEEAAVVAEEPAVEKFAAIPSETESPPTVEETATNEAPPAEEPEATSAEEAQVLAAPVEEASAAEEPVVIDAPAEETPVAEEAPASEEPAAEEQVAEEAAPAEEAAQAAPEWKQAAERGDLAAAVASVPDDAEHEGDRHSLYKDLVSQNEESDLSQALAYAQQWYDRVGDGMRDEVQGIRSRLYKRQVAHADKDTVLSALIGLQSTGAAAAVVGALAIQSAKKLLEEGDLETTTQVLGTLEVDSLSEAQKEQAGVAYEKMARAHREAGREAEMESALERLTGLGAEGLVKTLRGEVVVGKVEGLLANNDFDAALTEIDASTLAGEQRQTLLLAALRGQLAASQAAGETDKEAVLFTRIRETDPQDVAALAYFAAGEAAAAKAAADAEAAAQAATEAEAAAAAAAAAQAAADAEAAAAVEAQAAAPAAESGLEEEFELPENHDDAINRLRDVLVADPKKTAAHRAAYKKFGDKNNARKLIDLYRELQKINPDSSEFLLYLARAYCHVGKDTLAVVQFRKLLSNDPQPEVYLDLTRAYRRLKKIGDAVKTVDQALEAMPGHPAPLKEQVIILSLSEAYADAAKIATEASNLAGILAEDKAWFEKAAELTGANAKLPDDMTETAETF